LRRFDQGVDVVGHPAVGNHDPSAAIDFFGQTVVMSIRKGTTSRVEKGASWFPKKAPQRG
jgi:hypothetical protein